MSKTPKLRFPEFSGEWEHKKLGALCNITMGQSPSSKYYNDSSDGLPLIQGNADVKNRKTHPRIYTSVVTKQCDIGDIIMSVRAPVGAVSKSVHKACIGRGVCSIKPIEDNEYLYQVFLYLEDKWKGVSQGSTFESISKIDVTDYQIAIPSLQEQQKIASFLSLVDKKIEKQSEKVEAIKEYKKGMMQKIFSREIRFKDDEGKEFPEWEEKKLSNITVCLDNKRKPLNSSERDKRKGTIPYYGANGIVDYIDDFIFNEELILLAEDGGNFDDYSTRPIAQLIKGKSWVNNHTHVLHCKINTTYVFYTLVHKDIRKYINGTSRAKLNKADMLEIVVQVPNIQEQQKIANFLSTIDKKLEKEEEKLEALRIWKKGLLQQMFV